MYVGQCCQHAAGHTRLSNTNIKFLNLNLTTKFYHYNSNADFRIVRDKILCDNCLNVNIVILITLMNKDLTPYRELYKTLL